MTISPMLLGFSVMTWRFTRNIHSVNSCLCRVNKYYTTQSVHCIMLFFMSHITMTSAEFVHNARSGSRDQYS